uniref:ER membrane protein complex subunit 10 n=1 Tax=Aplanochytrium stocchinoi TaxID=215587 RepID=A0A7S3PTA5_9STRA|mmetsp:Transcript_7242/g.9170  ORF Transcript_7242/g.9170 Transcript_7242/m.9170 type:complete len:289 (+) Transcript_7242:156-1022(+)
MKMVRFFAAFAVVSLFMLCPINVYADEGECDASISDCSTGDKTTTGTSTEGVTTYPIQHSFSYDGQFVDRGKLLVQVMKKSKKISIKFSSKTYEFSSDEMKGMKKLVENNRLYRVRIPLKPDDPSSPWLVASIPACQMLENDFKESFRFHLDKSGTITSFELSSKTPSRECSQGLSFPKSVVLKSKAVASIPKEAHGAPKRGGLNDSKGAKVANMPPELQGVIEENKPKSKDGKEAEEEAENQSFVRKYWYLFLPMLLMSVFGGSPEPQAGAAGQGRSPPAGGQRKKK